MPKVIITDYIDVPDIEQEVLGSDVEVICLNEESEINFPDIIEDADVILVWHSHLTELTFQKLKSCRAIIRYGVGYDGVDFRAAKRNGINFANTPDYGVDEVADTASGMILSLIRKLPEYNLACQSYKSGWQEHTLGSIKRTNEHKLGIIGMGRIGSAVGLRMKAFGMEVAFYDPYIVSGYEKTLGVKRFDSIHDLQSFSSIISVHAPLTDKTKGMINTSFIDHMNDGCIFVNTARGKILDGLDTLYEGLRSGKLAGVGLDVLPDEPPSESESLIIAWKDQVNQLSSRILITPHTAYYSQTAWIEMRQKAAENAGRALSGQPLKNIIDFS
jgi:phosphoglycerate dehydrogenase-like enzyme